MGRIRAAIERGHPWLLALALVSLILVGLEFRPGNGSEVRVSASLARSPTRVVTPTPMPHPQRPPPNIVLILTDDQRWDSLWAMPRVEHDLVAHGVTFTNAFVVNSLCCPSRASILTGRYSHGTGVYTNGPPLGGAEAFDPRLSIATVLHRRGYRTALIGKYLNDYGGNQVPPGWDEWDVFNSGDGGVHYVYYTLNENGRTVPYGTSYSTDVLAAKAVRFATAGPQPFFLYFAPIAPHLPAIPAPQDRGSFPHLPAAHPLPSAEANVSDKPPWVRRAAARGRGPTQIATADRAQLASLQAVDRAVHRLVTGLAHTGRLRDTLIVFTSDNGLLLGEHGLLGKKAAFEPSIRVPMIVRFDRLGALAGRDHRIALNIDLAPTFADAAGTTMPNADGTSLLDLLRYPDAPGRSDFLVEHAGKRIPSYCAVRSRSWKYVYYADGSRELYHLRTDPGELRNLAGDPAYAAREQALAARLLELCDPPPPGLTLPKTPRPSPRGTPAPSPSGSGA
jgi:arylsulfatase A-like enzyme